MVRKCTSTVVNGKPCRGNALTGKSYCWAHDPELADRRAEGQRKGGEARANARRAAKAWSAIGEQVTSDQLPAILRACMFSVEIGAMEPAQASAIATLAKTSVSITNEIELERRLQRLEERAGIVQPSPLHRVK